MRPRTPAISARWYGAALRLVGGADRELLMKLAGAESEAGRLEESRRALLEALVLTPAGVERIGLVASCAAVEHWLGRHEDAVKKAKQRLMMPRFVQHIAG